MAYHVVCKRNGKNYHYLVKDIQVEGGQKKVSVYLGRGELLNEEIKYLMKEKMPKLKERIGQYLKNMEPLYCPHPKVKTRSKKEGKRKDRKKPRRLDNRGTYHKPGK